MKEKQKPQLDRPERLRSVLDDCRPDTLAIRAGEIRSVEGEHRDPIYATSSFVFTTAREAAARFAMEEPGNIYSRFTNPTVRAFEQRMAALEGMERGVATASGMAAILTTFMGLLQAGDHIVCSRSVFGNTHMLLNKFLRRVGIESTFVDQKDYRAWQQAMQKNTRLAYLETPSNPLCHVSDIQQIADLCHEAGVKLIVDNVFLTPALQRPVDFGADIVLHSATKYLDGQGRCVGGVVCGSDEVMEDVYAFLRTGGAAMSPFNAWVFQTGLETLSLRMQAQCSRAMKLARWLAAQDGINIVHYPGLESHPHHELASAQLRADLEEPLYGAVLSFEVQGDQAAAWRFIDATRVLSITANLGDVRSTITHPATTTHGKLTQEERDSAGIRHNLVRVAVGLEDVADIQDDLCRGLKAAMQGDA